jgi:hypothetical protein
MTIELGGDKPNLYVLPMNITLSRGSRIGILPGKAKGSHIIVYEGKNLLDEIQLKYNRR